MRRFSSLNRRIQINQGLILLLRNRQSTDFYMISKYCTNGGRYVNFSMSCCLNVQVNLFQYFRPVMVYSFENIPFSLNRLRLNYHRSSEKMM